MNRKAALHKQQERLDEAREILVSKISHIPDEDKNIKPAPDKWSINQVLSHLFQSEAGTYKYVTYKIEKRENIKPSGIMSRLRIWALKLAFWLPVKYKAPKVTATVPDQLNYQELMKEWDKLREGYRALSQHFPPELFGQNIFNHPIMGRLNIIDTYEFLVVHMHQHFKQIDGLVEYLASEQGKSEKK